MHWVDAHLVDGKENRLLAVLGQLAQRLHERVGVERVQPRGRLIQQEHAWHETCVLNCVAA